MDAPPVKPGDLLAGKYRVDRVLGAGGMGVVVAATHLDLREGRAIKFLRTTALSDEEAVERFMREARASSRLRGEHVARVYDFGRLDDGAPYMVMELLSGADLREVLRQRGQLPVGEAMLYLLQACEALAEAHAQGIVHRDLKPANLFLTKRADGTPCVKVLDFGISKILGDHGDGHSVTKSYAILGSPYYMSPEQMRSSRDVDARTDVWSLGVIGYQLVSGGVPFNGRTITEIITSVLQGKPEPPSSVVPGLPRALDAALLRCLERDLGRRYANVADLAAAIVPFAPREARKSFHAVVRMLGPPPPPAADDVPTVSTGERAAAAAPGPGLETGGTGTWGSRTARFGASPVGVVLSGAVIGVAIGFAAYVLWGGAQAGAPATPDTAASSLVQPVIVPSATGPAVTPAGPASAPAPASAARPGGRAPPRIAPPRVREPGWNDRE